MRSFFLASLVVALVVPCGAAEKLIELTPLTLDGWTVTGTGANTLLSGNSLVLPAGAQLSRKFSDAVVVVHLVAQPVFSESGEDWPILGLGSVALAFVRQNGLGHLVLVVDETTATDLPWTVSLDPGEIQDPIDLLLAYDRVTGTGLVSFQNQVRVFDVAPSAKPTELWLSSGVRSTWPVDLLQVLLPDLPAVATGTSHPPSPKSSETGISDTSLRKLQAALDQLRAKSEAAGGVATQADQTKAASGRPSLEVFTPPAVRRTHIVSAVRDAVIRSQAK